MQQLYSGTHIARKQHRCDSCERTIELGETYYKSFQTNGAEGWQWKAHQACNLAGQVLWKEGIEGDEGCILNVCDMDEEERLMVHAAAPDVYCAIWGGLDLTRQATARRWSQRQRPFIAATT